MIEKRLKSLWGQLQGKKPHMRHFLAEVRLAGIRGIDDLRVLFDYPVSVIAGGNASGKSTVLFAAACAYKVPGAGVKDFVPSTLFPDHRPKTGQREDEKRDTLLDFDYSTPTGRQSMLWKRGKSWSRSFHGRRNAVQPERPLYLRTLSNLSNPSEVRSHLKMARRGSPLQESPLTASQIEFAQQMLPFRYAEVVGLSGGSRKDLLLARQEGGAAYSEFHMAAGERSILRLAREIAQLQDALVLIDEVEAGLHPWVQQLLMLQLQQLALRNDLQVIVTSHSPVVLDSVPENARIFLDRDSHGKVTVQPPYHDIVQNALYGRSGEALNLLCEDESAEAMLRGIFDVLLPRRSMASESVRIGRDTGADEFPTHASAFSKFGQIRNFVFVLDGDKRDGQSEQKIHEAAGFEVPVLFLPGHEAPEAWIWNQLGNNPDVAAGLHIRTEELTALMDRQNAIYDSSSDSTAQKAKSKLHDLAEDMNHSTEEICRIIARLEASRVESDIQPLMEQLDTELQRWRAG